MSVAQRVDIHITNGTYGTPTAMGHSHSRSDHSPDPSRHILRLAGQRPKLKRCPPSVQTLIGRYDIIVQMRECFVNGSRYQRIFVLCGLRGAGKTQITLKFVEMCQGETMPRWVQHCSYLDFDLQSCLASSRTFISPMPARPKPYSQT